MSSRINEIDNIMYFTTLIRKPYLPTFFKCISQYLSEEDFSKFLAYIWTIVEYPNNDKNVSKFELVKYFKKANKEFLMEAKELKYLNRLPDEIIVYRGVKDNKYAKSLSWTMKKSVAKWFVERFDADGEVYKAKIQKKDVLAYFNGRNESEIVLDYRKLYDIERIK